MLFLSMKMAQVFQQELLRLPSEANTGICLNKPKHIATKFRMCPPECIVCLQNALNLIPSTYGSTLTVSSPSHTCNYPGCHLYLTSQCTPAILTVFFGGLPKWPVHKISPRTSAEMHCLLSCWF